MKLGFNIEDLAKQINDASAEDKAKTIVDVVRQIIEDSQGAVVAQYQAEYSEFRANKDNFAKYGLRNLNQKEKEFIQKITDPKQLAGAFPTSDQEDLIPETITNYIFEDLRQEHPILKYVDWAPAGIKKWLLAEKSGKAIWGKLDAAITAEITAALDDLSLDAHKLSAFAFIPKGIVDLGYEWVERYIREVLLEVNEDGLEEGVIAGDGDDAPIGLLKRLTGAVDGVYPNRTAVPITDFSVESLGAHFSTLSDGGKRKVSKVLLIVNPNDAFTKVAAASTYFNAVGEYKNAFPFNVEVIQSVHVPANRAILYLPKTYKLGATRMGISYSDHYQFLEDNRVFKIVTYGNGRLVKENQTVVLDITNLKPLAFLVKDVGSEGV